MKPKSLAIAFVCCFLVFVFCNNAVQNILNQFNKPPDIAAFTRAVKVNLPLAYAANIAMEAMNKTIAPGVTVIRPPNDSFPCTAIVYIPVDRIHPLPVGKDTAGAMMVMGLWADSTTALVTVFFTQTNISDGTFLLRDVSFVPVIHDTSGTMVVFASEDVNTGMDSSFVMNAKLDSILTVKLQGVPTSLPSDSALAVNQKAWITLAKRPAGTEFGNETYSMYGASQYLGIQSSTTEIIQAVMVDVRMTPHLCRLNPDSGYAMIRDMKIQSQGGSNSELGTTVLSFKPACSGQATILLATGEYLARTGSTIALNLDR
jgi:hypothetical protein